MKKLITFAVFAIALGLISACNQQAPHGSIGILNLGKVSDETGNAERIKNEFTQTENRLKNQLLEIHTKLTKELEEKKKKLGNSITIDQLDKMKADINNKFNLARKSAAIELNNKKQELVKVVLDLRDTVRPIAKKIAQQRSIKLVMIQNDNIILAYDEAIDITDAVITELKKQQADNANKEPTVKQTTVTETTDAPKATETPETPETQTK